MNAVSSWAVKLVIECCIFIVRKSAFSESLGISCGLSAPYVAGQLNYCLSSSGVRRPIIIGFNPVSMAREVVPEGCKENFRQLLEQMDAGMKHALSCLCFVYVAKCSTPLWFDFCVALVQVIIMLNLTIG